MSSTGAFCCWFVTKCASVRRLCCAVLSCAAERDQYCARRDRRKASVCSLLLFFYLLLFSRAVFVSVSFSLIAQDIINLPNEVLDSPMGPMLRPMLEQMTTQVKALARVLPAPSLTLHKYCWSTTVRWQALFDSAPPGIVTFFQENYTAPQIPVVCGTNMILSALSWLSLSRRGWAIQHSGAGQASRLNFVSMAGSCR